jgi:hypothetical protein
MSTQDAWCRRLLPSDCARTARSRRRHDRRMVFDRAGLWVVLIVCSAIGVTVGLWVEFRRRGERAHRRVPIARVFDAAMLGLGAGMALAFVILALASLFARLG